MATKKESDRAKILQQRIAEDNARASEAKKAWEEANPDELQQQKEFEALKRQKEAEKFAELLMRPNKKNIKTVIEIAFELNIPVDQLRADLKKLGIFPTRDEILSNAIQEHLSAIYQKKSSESDKRESIRLKYEALKLKGQEIANANKSRQQEDKAFAFKLMPQKEASKQYGGIKCNKCGYLWDTRKRIGLPARCPRCSATSIGINWV